MTDLTKAVELDKEAGTEYLEVEVLLKKEKRAA